VDLVVHDARIRALKILFKGYKQQKQVPMSFLMRFFHFESESECIKILTQYGAKFNDAQLDCTGSPDTLMWKGTRYVNAMGGGEL